MIRNLIDTEIPPPKGTTNNTEEIVIARRSMSGDIKVEMKKFTRSQKAGMMINQKRVFRTKLKLNEHRKKQNTKPKGHNGKLNERKSQWS